MDKAHPKQQHLCYMLSEIDALREDLKTLAADRGSMCDPEVVALSMRLDLLIDKYYRALSSPSGRKAATESS